MAERTNLITPNNPVKYILGSILLLALSGVGIFLIAGKTKKEMVEVATPTAIPTVPVIITPTIVIEKTEVATETAFLTVTPTLTATPTATKAITITPTVSVIPTIKLIESYENKVDGFSVRYDSKRKLVVENEEGGKRYVFSSSLGNITVHVGKVWSWKYPGRAYTDKQLIDGTNSSVYDISNQKLVDVEKGELKYTIQCVHNAKEILKTECQKFLEDFKFL